MKITIMKNFILFLLLPFVFSFFAGTVLSAEAEVPKAKKMLEQGLPKDALEILRPFLLDSKNVYNKDIAAGVVLAEDCMQQLNQFAAIENFLEDVLKIHQEDWHAVSGVITAWKTLQQHPYGSITDNKFQRGQQYSGSAANAGEHDRVRILQLYRQALLSAAKEVNQTESDKAEAAQLYLNFAELWNTIHLSWKMQMLTDLSVLPDYSADNYFSGYNGTAPVDEDGNPVLYHLPESFEKAKNDGERWRWCLAQAAELNPDLLKLTLLRRANFAHWQFGEQTLQEYSFFQNRRPADTESEAGIWNLESLKDSEVIAKTAAGIKRFELPEEFHFIALWKQCGNWETLAEISKNRMQYEKAVAYYEKILADASTDEDTRNRIKDRIAQITGNWGRFDSAGSDVKGTKPFLRYVFRNGKKVHLTANEIKVPLLLEDIKSYLKSKPAQLNWQKIQIEQIGWNMICDNQNNNAAEVREKYLGKEVAAWDIPLNPAEKYYDDAVQIDLKFSGAGAFLVKAEMENGNTQYAVVWLTDTAIVQKQLDKAVLYYIADSQTGQPLPDVILDFFGYNVEQHYETVQNNRQRLTAANWNFNEFSRPTDKNGFVILCQDKDGVLSNLNFLITAKTSDSSSQNGNSQSDNSQSSNSQNSKKRFAYFGFSSVWFANRYDEQYHEVKTFFISDRPVYRPGDTVKYKFWAGTAKYDQSENSDWVRKSINYEIYNPKGEKISEQTVNLDSSGGYAGELVLPKDCPLGMFTVHFSGTNGSGTFRVEEYKKPEYEVSVDAPKEPVKLGDKITAVIKAKYYFGSPVSEATVKYKVLREKANDTWYPVLPWDWFYGSGYGWFSYDAPWLSGFYRWGCCRPSPLWNHYYQGPPEVVSEVETKIKPDGTVDVVIDTSSAKAIFPDDSQRYTITAEVIDNSRRTITGSGTVLAAKEPFKVYAWTDKGYYVEKQKVAASFQARRLDGKPVSGDAEVKVFRLTYNNNLDANTLAANEIPVHSAAVKFNEDGFASIPLTAAAAGQYKISCLLNGQEGGYVFNVYADNNYADNKVSQADSFRYNALELIPDKTEYKSGENVQLRINTGCENAAVLLFIKPSNGVASFNENYKPQLLQLSGKTHLVSVPVELKDMPNFFVEALTISGGIIANEVKEIAVPPVQKVLNVDIKPSSETRPLRKGDGEPATLKPGRKAKAEIIITDLDGKPVAGQTVVSIYDKSVEYISGGSNVPDIKEYFWKWRRHHYPQVFSNLDKYVQSFNEPGEPDMQNLGIFDSMYFGSMHERRKGINRSSKMSNEYSSTSNFAGAMMVAESIAMDAAALPKSEAVPRRAVPMKKSDRGEIRGMGNLTAGSQLSDMSGQFGGILDSDGSGRMDERQSGGKPELVEAVVRKNFADTALWVGALETGQDGRANIELTMPETLTTWKINAWNMSSGTRVGYGTSDVITRKDLIIRMQTPRFLVEKDKCVFTANVHNYLSQEKDVDAELILDNTHLIPAVSAQSPAVRMKQSIKIPSQGEARIDWETEAKTAGDAVITMKALTDEESDAMQKTLPVFVHGILKQEARSGYIPAASSAEGQRRSQTVEIDVPAERKAEQTKLTVRFSPALAPSMLDALPYLTDYPYGCTEQTLNRFLPTVIVKKILTDMKIDLAKIKDIKTNLNAQELGGEQLQRQKAGYVRILEKRNVNPVFDAEQVVEMVRDGIVKLTNEQNADGGWGWFGGYGSHSSAHLTSLVLHGLSITKANDAAVNDDVLRRGIDWLKRYQSEQVELIKTGGLPEKEQEHKRYKTEADDSDAFIYMVLSEFSGTVGGADLPAHNIMKNYLWRDKAKLSLYGAAVFGIALTNEKETQLNVNEIVKIIEQHLIQDDENQTAYLNLRGYSNWCWWSWYGSEFETQAYYLKLLMRTNAKSEIAPKLVKYLLNNRRHASYWNSTRDTAVVIEAFAEYLKATGEAEPDMTVEVLFDGQVKKSVKITPDNLFTVDNTLILSADEVSDGKHKIELRILSDGESKNANPLYYNVYLQNFTLEDPIKKTGLEVKIERKLYKLERDTSAGTQTAGGHGQVVNIKTEKYKRVPFSPDAGGADIVSGDLIEADLTVESKNDYEYILIEDLKAAGLEPVEVRSGYSGAGGGSSLYPYTEFRDERVSFFVERLPRGKHSLTYRLRAEQPGRFSALPAKVEAMYAPELKANSDEDKVNITDK